MIRSFLKGVFVTVLCIVSPSLFAQEAEEHDAKLPKNGPVNKLESAKLIQRAFLFNSLLTGGFAGASFVVGMALKTLDGPASDRSIKILQFASAVVLLIGALATLDWEIQTFNGRTLIEKVNK